MTDYPNAKAKALQYFADQGRVRGYSPTAYEGEQSITDGQRMIARVRATGDQGFRPRFAVDDEVNFEPSDYDSAFTIILRLFGGDSWDPKRDDFYPVHLQTIKREATPTGNTQQVTVDLSTLSHWRNDFSRLFPDDNQNRTGPDWDDATNQQKSLNQIAQNLNR
jgi:hypothetical protein